MRLDILSIKTVWAGRGVRINSLLTFDLYEGFEFVSG